MQIERSTVLLSVVLARANELVFEENHRQSAVQTRLGYVLFSDSGIRLEQPSDAKLNYIVGAIHESGA